MEFLGFSGDRVGAIILYAKAEQMALLQTITSDKNEAQFTLFLYNEHNNCASI